MEFARERKFLAGGGLIVDNKINLIINDVEEVLAGRAGQINSCQSPTVGKSKQI